jgi:hypothetical protein
MAPSIARTDDLLRPRPRGDAVNWADVTCPQMVDKSVENHTAVIRRFQFTGAISAMRSAQCRGGVGTSPSGAAYMMTSAPQTTQRNR